MLTNTSRYCGKQDLMLEVKYPTQVTLRKYGLTLDDWTQMLQRQGSVCAVCKRLPSSGRLCVDHDHCKGFKKMSPEEKKKHCRGLLCFFCNRYYVGRSITIEKSKNVTAYLEAYEARKLEQDQKLDN